MHVTPQRGTAVRLLRCLVDLSASLELRDKAMGIRSLILIFGRSYLTLSRSCSPQEISRLSILYGPHPLNNFQQMQIAATGLAYHHNLVLVFSDYLPCHNFALFCGAEALANLGSQ